MTDTTTPPRRARIAQIGCGHWGKNLARNFHAVGGLAAVADTDPEIARRHAEMYDVPALSWEDVLASAEIDAVAIAAPAELHAQLAAQAMSAGKDVYVEKPLALDLDAAEELCRQAERDGRVLMVGHLLQYHPAFLKLREIVREGRLGRLQYLYSNRLNLGKIRREENILWSFAPHDISMILSLTGQEPNFVSAVGAQYLHERIADITTTHLAFPAGERAHIFVSWLHPFKEQKLVLVGDAGMATFDDSKDWGEKIVYYAHKVEWRDGLPAPSKADGEPVPVTPDEPLKLECQHFLDCIANRARPRTDGAEGLRVLRVLQQAQAALERGQGPATEGAVPAPASASTPAPSDTEARFPEAKIHESAYVDQDCEIGPGSKIWHFSHVLANSRIGRNCVLGQNVAAGPEAEIGDNCKVQNNVSLYKGVILEDGVFCGPSCVFTNVMTPRAEVERKNEFQRTRVCRGATIGANATIVCGTTIGAYALIGAGAVINRDVPAHALMAGVPARRIGWVSHAGERLGPDLVCPRDGRKYRQVDDNTLEEITS